MESFDFNNLLAYPTYILTIMLLKLKRYLCNINTANHYTTMKRNIILAFALAFVTTAWAQQRAPRSKVITDTIHSAVLNADRPFNVYLPKSYEVEPDRYYPVLYLLHGMYGNNTSWFTDMKAHDLMDQLAASGEAQEMIIVSPHAGGRDAMKEQNGYFNMPGWNYEDFFFTEFLPYIESTYRIKGDKEHRAVAGLSMGGGGTTVYAQKHPDMFSSAYAMSALMDVPGYDEGLPQEDPENKVYKLMSSVRDNSAINFVKNADDATKDQLRTVAWFVDCGDDDFLLDRNIEFFQAMRDADIPLQFRVRDGAHVSEYWHTALYYSLPFASRNFGK